MNNQGIGSWINRRAKITPWKAALIGDNSEWTYAELSIKITQLAHGFRSFGVHRGDRIAYLNLNHSSYIETFFACGLLGAVFVPLNIRLVPENINYILDKAGCNILIYGPTANKSIEILKSTGQMRNYICMVDNTAGDLTFSALTADQPDSPIDECVSLDETALILFTSGTTGKPKGVMLSHNNLTWNVFNLLSCSDFLADDRILVNAPLNRMGALGVAVLPGIFKGATLVLSAETDIKKIVEIIEVQKISVLFNGPDFFNSLDMFSNEQHVDFSSIRFCIVGGDVIPPTLVQRWLNRGVQFQQGYGLTEAAPVALLLDKEEMLSKNGSAGRPMFFTDIRVVSPDMKDVKAGESGEIILKGPNITKGYWENPSLTDERITHNGWLHSGDVARVDSDDHLYILGRVKDGILLQDRIVYPSEIENIIINRPEVAECAAIGIPGKKNDNIVIFVVLKDNTIFSESELLEFLSDKLPTALMPKCIRLVELLPKNANGKILRQKLRESYIDLKHSQVQLQND